MPNTSIPAGPGAPAPPDDWIPTPWCPVCGVLAPGTDEADHHSDVHGCGTLAIAREMAAIEVARRERER